MSQDKLDDHFIFIYGLEPAERCLNFRFNSTNFWARGPPERVASFAVWRSMLALFYSTAIDAYPPDVLRETAHYFATTIVSSYAWLTGKPLELIRKNWVEVRGQIQSQVAGIFQKLSDPPLDHPENEIFQKIVPLTVLSLGNIALARALHDYHTCLSSMNSDFYFYAYRAVEDIRSHFSVEEDDDGRRKSWVAMNGALGRKQEDYRELVDLAKQSRHSNIVGAILDEESVQKQLRFIRSLIQDFIEYLSKSTDASKTDTPKHATTT